MNVLHFRACAGIRSAGDAVARNAIDSGCV